MILVFKNRNFLLLSDFVKIVHVELPDKRGKLFMFEVFGQNLVLEKIFIFDNEAVSIISPLYNMCILFIFKYLVGLHDEIGYFLLAMHTLFVCVCLGLVELIRLEIVTFLELVSIQSDTVFF